jgi:hypothetical protein
VRLSRLVLIGGMVVLAAMVVLIAVGVHGALTPLVAMGALVFLIGGGNLLYGKNSHGAAAQARVRPAQEAHNRAIDEARLEARRQTQAQAQTQTQPQTQTQTEADQ